MDIDDRLREAARATNAELAEIDLPAGLASAPSGRARRSRWRRIAAAAAGGALVAGLGVAGAAVLSDDPEQRVFAPVDHVDIPDDERMAVADQDGRPVGYADRRLILPPDAATAKEHCTKPVPVADEDGDVVGYFFRDYGYVDRSTAETPGFSIKEARTERYGDELPPTC